LESRPYLTSIEVVAALDGAPLEEAVGDMLDVIVEAEWRRDCNSEVRCK
jgi:hypothetical protein